MLKQLRESQQAFEKYCESVESIQKHLMSDITMLQGLYSKYLSDKANRCTEISSYHAELCKVICSYSEFDLNMIGPILADIASIFEGKKYIFSEIESCTGCAFLEPAGNDGNLAKAIVLKSKMNSQSEKKKYKLRFYTTYHLEDVYPSVSFRNLDYLQGYIDKVIQYRSDNEIDTISQDELESLKWDYLADSMSTIKMKHQTMFDEEEQRITAIISDRNKRSKQFEETVNIMTNGIFVKEKKK